MNSFVTVLEEINELADRRGTKCETGRESQSQKTQTEFTKVESNERLMRLNSLIEQGKAPAPVFPCLLELGLTIPLPFLFLYSISGLNSKQGVKPKRKKKELKSF